MNTEVAASFEGNDSQITRSLALMHLIDMSPAGGKNSGYLEEQFALHQEYEEANDNHRKLLGQVLLALAVILTVMLGYLVYARVVYDPQVWLKHAGFSFSAYLVCAAIGFVVLYFPWLHVKDVKASIAWDHIGFYLHAEARFNQLFPPMVVGENPTTSSLKQLIETTARAQAKTIKRGNIPQGTPQWERFEMVTELASMLELCGADKCEGWDPETLSAEDYHKGLKEQIQKNLLAAVPPPPPRGVKM